MPDSDDVEELGTFDSSGAFVSTKVIKLQIYKILSGQIDELKKIKAFTFEIR